MTDEPKLRDSVNIEKTTALNPANISDTCMVCDLTIPESGVGWRLVSETGLGGAIHRKVHATCYSASTPE